MIASTPNPALTTLPGSVSQPSSASSLSSHPAGDSLSLTSSASTTAPATQAPGMFHALLAGIESFFAAIGAWFAKLWGHPTQPTNTSSNSTGSNDTTAPSNPSNSTGNTSTTAPPNPTGTSSPGIAVQPKYFSSVVHIVMENHSYSEVKDLPAFQYLIQHGANLTNYSDIGHPSGPNYRAMVAGQTWGSSETIDTQEPTVATEAAQLGIPTYDIAEFGNIAIRHDPYHDLHSQVIDQTTFNPDSLPADANVYIGGDDNNNGHDGTLAQVNTNIQTLLDQLNNSKWFNTPDASGKYPVLVVTWDEGDQGTSSPDHVFTTFYGRGVKPGNYSTPYNHYNLNRTLTDNWGLNPLGTGGSQASPISGIWQ